MPKAPSNNGSGSALRRNQACRTCRKKKLKCDAQRPHCGNCIKAWKGLISVQAPEGYAYPSEPQCSYDPIEGLTLAQSVNPTIKIKQLEQEILELKGKLQGAGISYAHATPLEPYLDSGERQSSPGAPQNSSSFLASPSSDTSTNHSNIALPRAGLAVLGESAAPGPSTARSETSSPPPMDPFMQLLFSGWNPDLPDPATMRELVNIFFRCDPCGSRILHRPSFLASMDLSPKDPRFPHSALLHAICASASRWSPLGSAFVEDGIRRDRFADYHAMKTRQYIDRTMASGVDIFNVLQACVILSWYFYSEGRWVEVWIFAGFQTRVAIPLRLNYPGTFTTHGNSSPGAYLAPPKDLRDLEMRRRTWWMSLVFDRVASVGGWLHAVDERDIGTEFPLRWVDFEAAYDTGHSLPPSNPQDMETPEVFITHLPEYTDSFLLLIKAIMLFGKVTDYNVRFQLRLPATPAKSDDPTVWPAFRNLDKLVAVDFLSSLPSRFQNFLIPLDDHTSEARIDTDLYMVHIIPHAAIITLHNPYINFENPNSLSTKRCVSSSRAILNAYYDFVKEFPCFDTSSPLTRLHPFVTICWYLSAVVLVQVCKRWIEVGDIEQEHAVWAEINHLRWAMLAYGAISPIGARQEKLLKQLMNEIVRLTKHDRPLEVGVPLYPFSHRNVFPRSSSEHREDVVAPLPVSFELSSSTSSHHRSHHSNGSHSWSSRSDLSSPHSNIGTSRPAPPTSAPPT